MENSVKYLTTLYEFYKKCAPMGAVKVIRNDNIVTCYSNKKLFFHFTEPMAMKIRRVCYIFPNLSLKNIKLIEDISNNYKDYLCGMRLLPNKSGMKFYLYDTQGKLVKKFKIKYFTLNMFKIPKIKVPKSNASKSKKAQ